MTLDEFNRRFRIVPTSLLSMPHDLSFIPMGDPVTGDCQDYTKTVKRILRVKFPRAIMIRCWSPQNKLLPRHAVLWVKGRGWIDSSGREFRRWPWPCVPVWPVGTPAILAVGYAAAQWWRFFA